MYGTRKKTGRWTCCLLEFLPISIDLVLEQVEGVTLFLQVFPITFWMLCTLFKCRLSLQLSAKACAHVTGIRPFSYNRMHFSTFCGDMKSESYLNKVRKNACHKNKLVYYLYECVREPSIAGLVWRICRKFDMQMVFPLNESAR